MQSRKVKEPFLKNKYTTDINIVLIYRLLIIYFLYTISRALFYVFNASHFEGMTAIHLLNLFVGGVKFDTTAILYINLLFLFLSLLPFRFRHKTVYQNILAYIFFITNGIGLLANFSDIPYFDFVLERTTIGVFDQFKHENNLVALVFKFIVDFWYISLLYIATIWLMVFLYKKVKISGAKPSNPFFYYPMHLIIMAAAIVLTVGGIRGGFKHSTRPITLSNAGEYVKAPIETAIVLNTPFCIMRSTEAPGYKRADYFTDQEQLKNLYYPFHDPDSATFKPDNIVIIIIESLNKEFIGSLNKNIDGGNYKGYTPFLDSLLQHAKTFKYSFANGRKSIDALPAVLASVPAIESPFVLTPYFKNNLSSLPALLKKKAYKSALFHGAPNGSMGFQAFGQIIGMDEYYGKDEYNNNADFDGIWGIWDEEFMQFFATTLDTFTQPFSATLFTVSSHHPFKLPEKHKGRFKDNDFELQKCIEYTDYSIRRFFETASKMDWYKNTLFIFTADHVSLNQRPEFQNEMGYFSVPVILYKPGSNIVGIDTNIIAQQIDILPTILDHINYDKEFFSFGKSLLNPGKDKFAVNYLNGTYRLYKGKYMILFDSKKTVGLYNMADDPMLTKNLTDAEPQLRDSLETFTKAFIQQYKNRMIDNKVSVERENKK